MRYEVKITIEVEAENENEARENAGEIIGMYIHPNDCDIKQVDK